LGRIHLLLKMKKVCTSICETIGFLIIKLI
jgi:hypothetical protein